MRELDGVGGSQMSASMRRRWIRAGVGVAAGFGLALGLAPRVDQAAPKCRTPYEGCDYDEDGCCLARCGKGERWSNKRGRCVKKAKPKPKYKPKPTCEPGSLWSAKTKACVELSCPEGTKLIARGAFKGHVIEDVCMDVTEVTVAAYHACSGCEAAGGTELFGSCNGNREDRQDHPVNCVSWTQAKTYCERQGARLPTEWEWEWAARGRGQGRTYPWGEEAPTCERVVMDESASTTRTRWGCDKESTWPVGSKPKGSSRDGLQDMSGNVWEWTSSLSSSGKARIVRGGGWDYFSNYLRAVYRRNGFEPTYRRYDVGFRCARTADRS
ncbi:MAG: SUMF1/EgtB/PvdO family nonheme iron enzyme [Nannocystaceae bacterium]